MIIRDHLNAVTIEIDGAVYGPYNGTRYPSDHPWAYLDTPDGRLCLRGVCVARGMVMGRIGDRDGVDLAAILTPEQQDEILRRWWA